MATKKDFVVKNGLQVGKSLTVDSDVNISGTLNVTGSVTGTYAGFDSDFNAAFTPAFDSAFNAALDSAGVDGTGLSYNSTTNTLSISNTGVTAGTYGSASLVPVLSVNAQGQIDSAGTVSVAGVSSTAFDSASHTLTINTADGGSFDQIVQTKMPGTAGSYGSAALVPVVTVNEYGLVDSINEVSVAGVSTFDFDSATGQLTIGTADGGSFSQVITLDPYTTSDVTFGSVTADSAILNQVSFATDQEHINYEEGAVWYDTIHKTLNYWGDDSNVIHEIGIEEHQRVYNNSGSAITKGTPLYYAGNYDPGGTPSVPTVGKADATDVNAYNAQGLAAGDIPNNSYGYVILSGLVEDVDTSALSAGQNFFVGLTPGAVQNASPLYPNYPMCLGWVVKSDATNGSLLVNQQNHSVNSFRVRTSAHVGEDLIVGGNLTVTGTQTITSTENVQIGGNIQYLNAGDTIGEANTTFVGTGLDDAFFSGHYNGDSSSKSFYVKIDATGTPDTFEWGFDSSVGTEATGISITGNDQLLDSAYGINIKFAATTGHTTGDKWTGTAAAVDTDTGFFSNRNTGDGGAGYTHVGLFFDASEDTWRLLSAYDSEPEAPININSPSLTYGDLRAGTVTASALTANGNITVTGTVDGRDIATDGGKLDGIESGATADQTKSDIDALNINADQVDGLEASQFLRSDASDTASGTIQFTNSYNSFGNSTGSVSNDGNWNARVNIAGSQHARLDVKSVSDGIITSMYSHTGQGVGRVGTYSNHPLALMTNGSIGATLLTNGNLGIGTTSPSYKLQVGNGSGTSPHLFLDGVFGTTNVADHARIYFNDPNFGIGAGGNGGSNDDDLYIWAYNGAGRDIRFAATTDGASAVNSGSWTTNVIIKNDGKVGIGTTAPDNKLTVKDANVIIDAQSSADGQTVGLRAGYLNHATLASFFRYTTGDAQLYIDNTYQGNNGVYSDINFRNCPNGSTSLQTRMKIKGSTGYVGIGTTSPEGHLDINISGVNDTQAVDWTNSASAYTTQTGGTLRNIILSNRHGATKHTFYGYTGPTLEFRNANASYEWEAGKIMGVVDPMGTTTYKGGLVFFANSDGSSSYNPAGRMQNGAESVVHMALADKRVYIPYTMNIGDYSTTYNYSLNTRPQIKLEGSYPHLFLIDDANTNTTHGPVISMGGFGGTVQRRWNIGVPANNPSNLSIGWYDNNGNPHYGTGDGWSADGNTILSVYTDRTQSKGSMRAPIFYDLDDTAYYVNPNSTSRIRKTNLIASGSGWDDGLNLYSSDATNRWNLLVDNGAGDPLRIAWNNSEAFQINTSRNVTALVDFRTPVVYDYNNTGYYFDGSNTGDSIRVAGDIVAYYSDARLKDFHGRINGALDKVLKINGYYYTENEKAKELGYNTGRTQVGVSAQEIEEVLPEVIKDAPIGHGYKTVQYERLVPLLIEAIKEQNDKIERLEAMVEKLINTNKG